MIMPASGIEETFLPRPGLRWRRTQVGGGQLIVGADGLRLALASARHDRYADAQIDDYAGLARHHFPWRPPLRMTLRARASGLLAGTAGFGFWNNPLAPLRAGGPALPSAIWFFHASPPSNMALARGVPGLGWKAACIDATQPAALAWAPLVAPILLLNRRPGFYARTWPRIQRALRIAEAPITALDSRWSQYTLEWREGWARFDVDGTTVLETGRPPRGPLGFVAWLDNQWAVVTPQGHFGWGLVDTGAQWLDLRQLRIEML